MNGSPRTRMQERRREFVRMAIYGEGETYCMPCGACRQVLNEFAPDIRVLVTWGDGKRAESTLPMLLPSSFGPKDLTHEATERKE